MLTPMHQYPYRNQSLSQRLLRLLFLFLGFVGACLSVWLFLRRDDTENTSSLANPSPATTPAADASPAIEKPPTPLERATPRGDERMAMASISGPQEPRRLPPPEARALAPAQIVAPRAESGTHVAAAAWQEPVSHDASPPLLPTQAAVSQASATQPLEQWPKEVVTIAEDSLWRIAARHYGDGRYFEALYEYNRPRLTAPERIAPGIALVLPAVAELRQAYPDLCPPPQ